MSAQYAQAVERERAVGQLKEIAQAHKGEPWTAYENAIAEWHLRELAAARAEAWIPGIAGPQDPVVEEALARFHYHHVRIAMKRLKAENAELRQRMLNVFECARFYASGATDGGLRALALIDPLTQPHGSANGNGKRVSL